MHSTWIVKTVPVRLLLRTSHTEPGPATYLQPGDAMYVTSVPLAVLLTPYVSKGLMRPLL